MAMRVPLNNDKGKKTPLFGRKLENADLDPEAKQYENLIDEIEQSEGHLGTALR